MPKNLNLSHLKLRRDYQAPGLIEKRMKAQPMQQFAIWFKDAVKKNLPDANAFILATADHHARPSARVLLMKGFNSRGITFFTNYASAKGRQLKANPRAEAVFFWNQLSRQVRLNGRIVKLSRKDSLAYFRTRPLLAQLAAAVSDQSRPISSRKILVKRFESLMKRSAGAAPDLPGNWGGYELRLKTAEFWQGQPNRLHDRLLYRFFSGRWSRVRLQP